MYVIRSATLLKMTLLQRCQLSGFSNLEHYSKMDQNCNWYFKVNTFTGVFNEFNHKFQGSGIPRLKNRVTDYDVIKRVKSNCDVIANFS